MFQSTAAPSVGARVVVPLGSRAVTGIVMAVDVTAAGVPESGIKPIRQLLDTSAFIPPHIIELARWTAEYYAAGAGEMITAVLPPKARGGEVRGHKTVRVAAITAAGSAMLQAGSDAGRPLTERQRRVLMVLAAAPDGVPTPSLAADGGSPDGAAVAGARPDWRSAERVDRNPFDAASMQAAPAGSIGG